jgi:hypothetical protein
MKKTRINYVDFFVGTLLVIAIIAFLALTTMLLWNLLMPSLIRINFWQAAGLMALASVLTCDKTKIFGWIYE